MSVYTIIETLLIGPLKLVFEIFFAIVNRVIGHAGLSIIALSAVVNIFMLPLHRRADAMQAEARDLEAKLQDGVAHIKKTFSGDERMMILQTYYRQNNYKPTDALNGSVSLVLEIPFFMAAYQFLSSLEILQGVSLGPIADLSAPDAMLVIGGMTINVLPILMTLVNILASALYLKDFPLKKKIQLYAMAGVFLVLLYNSPSGLVFYWTLNNVFSLVKTLFYKLKNPGKAAGIIASAAGLVLIYFVLFAYSRGSLKRKIALGGIGLVLQLPSLLIMMQSRMGGKKNIQHQPDKRLFICSSLFSTLLTGLLIPSSVLAASPQEFVNAGYFYHPLWYLVSAVCLAAGVFLVWMRVFYWLANPKGKVIFEKAVWVLCGIMLVNYMFFGTDLGILYSNLKYETTFTYTVAEQIINLAVLVVIAAVMYFIITKWRKAAMSALLAAVIAVSGMVALNTATIAKSIANIDYDSNSANMGQATLPLSKTGKNVVVLMLDRAVNEYMPYIFNEKPELLTQFAGFTHYTNVISFGPVTNIGSPSLYGGYEYTPVEINKRSTESLMSKHNESIKVLPVLFSENGYEVTVCDPPYANYQWFPDLSIYDEYPEIHTYITKGRFTGADFVKTDIESNSRNFFCFALMKSMPLVIQPTLYNEGYYNNSQSTTQIMTGKSQSSGIYKTFMEAYHVLTNLSGMTNITEDSINTFLIMKNDATHDPMLLQAPAYEPTQVVDNRAYDMQNSGRFTVDGKTLPMEKDLQMAHYHANMAAMIQLGNWFDYLRAAGVYDNTRIILVSDHGWYGSNLLNECVLDKEKDAGKNIGMVYPLLMVKDFGSTEFTTSDEFMTNADVPALAVANLIADPRNPFTGNVITNQEKFAHDQFISLSSAHEVTVNNGNTFLPGRWARVNHNIWDRNNWTFYDEDLVLDTNEIP